MKYIFQFCVAHRVRIIELFKIVHLVLTAAIVGAVLWHHKDPQSYRTIATAGLWSGKAALVLFVVVLVPGILRRFRLDWTIKNIIMLFRRHLGILTYMLSLFHFVSIWLIGLIRRGVSPFPRLYPFELMGIAALVLMSFLFVTSSDFMVRKLRVWWGRIHKLIYIIAWLIFFHVLLQRVSVWSVLIGIAAVFEVASLLYEKLTVRKKVQPLEKTTPL